MCNAMTDAPKPHQLLRHARENAGYRTASDFARAKGETETTYRAYENGSRPLTASAAKRLAPKLGIDDWRTLIGDDAQAEILAIDGQRRMRVAASIPDSVAAEVWMKIRVKDDQDRATVAAIADALNVSDPIVRQSVLQILTATANLRRGAQD